MKLLFGLLFLLILSCGSHESTKNQISPGIAPNPAPQPDPPSLPPPDQWPNPVPIPPGSGGDGGFPIPLPPGPNPMPPPAPFPGEGKELYLKAHNQKRCWHQADSLIWNQNLADKAKEHANRCIFAHDATANAGENLAIGYSEDSLAIKAWYDEVSFYDFSRGDFSYNTGHFTQMVWRGTTELGCAASQCPQGRFLVCRYLAPGNYLGEFRENVLPLRSDLNQCN